MATQYRVHLPETTVEVNAYFVNLGQRKLWFYDQEQNLIAVYSWDKIVGFEVIGSAQEQRLTEEMLHERKRRNQKTEALVQEKGEVFARLIGARQHLSDVQSALTDTWLFLNDERTKKNTETALLVRGHEAELRVMQAQIADTSGEVDKRVHHILDELVEMIALTKTKKVG